MTTQHKMVFWQGDRYWPGKLVDHPEIMSQGETLEELETNLRDAMFQLFPSPAGSRACPELVEGLAAGRMRVR